MPRRTRTLVELHPSWSFGDRRAAIEHLLTDIEQMLSQSDREIGVVVAGLLFAALGILREISPENQLKSEATLVEIASITLLHELDKMYASDTEVSPNVH